ncbi:MAG: glycosyltransferase family 1 protein [Vicinamibacterales bacterium]
MARIYLDARSANSTTSGVGRYAAALIDELALQQPTHEYIVVGGRQVVERIGARGLRGVEAGGSGSVGLALSRPLLSKAFGQFGPPDLYHALFHIVPYGIRIGAHAPARVVVTLHDLIWIDHAEMVATNQLTAAWRRTVGSALIPYALTTADHAICNSEATAARASDWLPESRRSVVHMGVGSDFLAGAEEEAQTTAPELRRTPAARYITAFGVAKPYKNITTLVSAFAGVRREHPDVRFVLLGGDGGARADIARLRLEDAVDVMAHVSDADLRAVIRGAQAHVVPSVVEGFGLPVLEAMALGTPVVTSDADALREVAGDAALSVRATDVSALTTALSRLLVNRELRERLSAAGRARARQFTWSRTAAGTLAVYDRVLGGSTPPPVSRQS